MSDIINTLPEIATELLQAGFSVSVTDDHNLIFITLKRRVSVQEVLDALGWYFIPSNVEVKVIGSGVAIVDDCVE